MFDTGLFFGDDFLSEDKESVRLSLKEGELREVSVLFADIKGFTSISNLFAPEVIHGKMDEIMKIFTKCINFYGGFVDKYMGDGIMALFGAKKATEQDTERCILAAIKMQEQLSLYNSLLTKERGFEGLELGLRIGINTGVVSVGKVGQSREGDFTVYGPQVNLASRMESNAPVNRIMLPRSTKVLVDDIFDFEHIGPVSVKGMDEPIDCWVVVAQKTVRMLQNPVVFLGREDELSILAELYSKSSMSMQLIGIVGEAGIGKSRLIQHFCKKIPQIQILTGTSSGICPSPLNLFSRMFENYFGITHNSPMPEKKTLLEKGIAELSRNSIDPTSLIDVLPLIGLLLDVRYEDPRLRLKGNDLLDHVLNSIDLVISNIINKSQFNNLHTVFVIDDLHLIDDASSKALRHLVNKISEQSKLLLIATYRLEHTIPDYIRDHFCFNEMQLHRLSDQQTLELIKQYTQGKSLNSSTLNKVIELSAGNPFFIEEWCSYVGQLPNSSIEDLPVPGNLHALILSRLDNLPHNLRLLLHKASVIGNEFFVQILKEIEKRLQDPIDVDAILDELEQHTMIMKQLGYDYSTYYFKHLITREVAYQTLLHQNRKMLHQLTAEAIEAIFPDRIDEFVYSLAEHYLKAELADKAKQYLNLAFNQALKLNDSSLALDLGKSLLTQIDQDDVSTKYEVLIQLADVDWLIGNWDEAFNKIEEAASLIETNDVRYCEIYKFNGMAAFYSEEFDSALDEFSKGLDLATAHNDKLMICIASSNLGIWYQHKKDHDKALSYHMKSLDLAIELNDHKRQAKTYSNLGLIYVEQKEFEKAEEVLSLSLNISEEYRYLRDESIAVGNLGWVFYSQQRYESAIHYFERKLKISTKLGDKLEIINTLNNLADSCKQIGRFHDAIEAFRQLSDECHSIGDLENEQATREIIQEIEACFL